MINFGAVAYRRFDWATDRPGYDIEKALNQTGQSVIAPSENGFTVYPGAASFENGIMTGFSSAVYTEEDLSEAVNKGDAIFVSVAAGTPLLLCLQLDLDELAKSYQYAVTLSRQRIGVRDDGSTAQTQAHLRQVMVGELQAPVVPLAGDFAADPLVRLGDGNIGVDEIRRAYDYCVSNYCHKLGVHAGCYEKAERLITAEADPLSDAVELVRLNEIRERQRIAAFTGWSVTDNTRREVTADGGNQF